MKHDPLSFGLEFKMSSQSRKGTEKGNRLAVEHYRHCYFLLQFYSWVTESLTLVLPMGITNFPHFLMQATTFSRSDLKCLVAHLFYYYNYLLHTQALLQIVS
jgi:hypothetical protein